MNPSVTVWPEPIWKKVYTSELLLPQHQRKYPRGPESALIEIPPFRPYFITFSKTVFYLKVNLVSQCSHLEVLLLSKFGSDVDSGPPMYVLWCCGGICHQVFTFVKIGSGHTVP